MQITKTEPIKWHTWRPMKPGDWPCWICKAKEATVNVTVQVTEALTVTLPTCPECATEEALREELRRSE